MMASGNIARLGIVLGVDTAELEVKILNRWGSLVYEARPYLNNWNGWSEKGSPEGPLPAATYFYYIDTHKKSQEPLKGYIEIQP
jgi:gliding motility-associated-like protein